MKDIRKSSKNEQSKKAHIDHHVEDRESRTKVSEQDVMKKKTKNIGRGKFHGPLNWFPEG